MTNYKETVNSPMIIEDDWFCYKVDLDNKKPYAILCHKETGEEEKILIPQKLAYYFKTHWCGSEEIYKKIKNDANEEMQNKLKELLGF